MPDQHARVSTQPAVATPERPSAPLPGSAAPGGAERRKNPRVQLPRGFMALIGLPELGGAPFAVSPRDMSRTGLGFYHSSELRPGLACTVTLRALNGELVMTHGRIVRNRPMAGRLFDVGVHFDRELDVMRFVEAPAATPTEAAPRDAGQARARIAQLATSMQRMAEGSAPLDDLFTKVEEMVRICESARPPAEDGPIGA
ncbi:MAG: PilZ domain-containing protein [Phycisphaerales bacterium]